MEMHGATVKILRKMFGPKRDWRKLHNKELYDV
jgi:hypothetical protein